MAHAAAPEEVRRRWTVVPFLDSDAIGDAWAICDLLLGRAGAGTITEVCAVGRAAVFVPLEPAGGDEQNRNAKWLANDGAAWILPQGMCSPESVRDTVLPLLQDPQVRRERAGRASAKAIPDAAERLADALLALAGGGRPGA